MRRGHLLAVGAALALGSALAVAQDAPESLLPPGFERPKPRPSQTAPADSVSVPVVQALPGEGGSRPTAASGAPKLPSGVRIPSLRELEAMQPDELDQLLGLKPKNDIPPAARRSLKMVGIIDHTEGGFPAGSLGGQAPALVKAALDGNKGQLVSRWGHILLRRALASRLDAPQGMNPADFAAMRAALLVRMGEGEAARALVQDVDAGNYSPALIQAALDSYAFTADVTGICPVISVHGGARKDADWTVLRSICAAFQGDGNAALAQLDKAARQGTWPRIDVLLAQKYAGAAGKARRAVKIEWDGVNELTPWRYALTIGTGLEPPAALMQKAPARYHFAAATAPMLPLTTRAAAADQAATAGILSSAAMIDLYGQIYAQDDITGEWATRADTLRTAYVGDTPAARLEAMRRLWEEVPEPRLRYGREVLTAYAAARLPVDDAFAEDADSLVAAMLAAGLDRNALRWAEQAEMGTAAWAMLVLAAPSRSAPVDASALGSFYDADKSEGLRKTRLLVAALSGLKRIEPAAAQDMAGKLGFNLARQTKWTRAIDQAADVNNAALVALLAGLGMQGDGWDKMTSVHLFHIVSALNQVGLGAEARMIAAEAIARG